MMMRILLAAGLGLAATHAATAQTKWNLPSAYPIDNPHLENLNAFSKDVADLTGNKLQITVHAAASLFKAPEIKRAVATGQTQAGEVLISLHENEDPIFGIDVVPFLATSYPQAKKLWAASKSAIEKKLAAQGMMVLFAVPWGPQGIYAKKDINSVDDMKGLKWRAYNVGTARIAELVGAQPVTIQAAELPQALATGVVNAFMTSGSTGYDSKAWETMTHFTTRRPGFRRTSPSSTRRRSTRSTSRRRTPFSKRRRSRRSAGGSSRRRRRSGTSTSFAPTRCRCCRRDRSSSRGSARSASSSPPIGSSAPAVTAKRWSTPIRRCERDLKNWRGPGGVAAEPPYAISRPVSRVL